MRSTVEQRIAWDDLPGPLKQAIKARTGPVTDVRIASAGQNSPLAAIIDARDGRVFVKGLPSAHRRVITQAREAAVAPLVRDISPALLWHFDEAGWNVLGYEYAPGRHGDYSPGSPDLDRLVQLIDALSAIKVPDDPGPLKRAEARWKPYLDDPETAAIFAGPVLTHSDWTPDNVLVSEHRAWGIDWACPTLGAAWTDPACWVLRLMASGGHTAHEAERQASRLPAFQAADPPCRDRVNLNTVSWAFRNPANQDAMMRPYGRGTRLPGSDTPDPRDASCREPGNLKGLSWSAGRS